MAKKILLLLDIVLFASLLFVSTIISSIIFTAYGAEIGTKAGIFQEYRGDVTLLKDKKSDLESSKFPASFFVRSGNVRLSYLKFDQISQVSKVNSLYRTNANAVISNEAVTLELIYDIYDFYASGGFGIFRSTANVKYFSWNDSDRFGNDYNVYSDQTPGYTISVGYNKAIDSFKFGVEANYLQNTARFRADTSGFDLGNVDISGFVISLTSSIVF